MAALDQTVAVLREVAKRADGGKPDLRPAAGAVNDLGRTLATASVADVRSVQSVIASVRERLEHGTGTVDRRPSEALRGSLSHVFLAGGLWAANELLGAYMQALQSAQARMSGLSEKAATRLQLLTWLRMVEVGTPGDFAAYAEQRGLAVKPSVISKALGDLFTEGLVQDVQAPPGADRRNRFIALTSKAESSGEIAEALAVAREAVRHVNTLVGGWARTRAVFEEAFADIKLPDEIRTG